MSERPRWLTEAARSGTDLDSEPGHNAQDNSMQQVVGGRRSLSRLRRRGPRRRHRAERAQGEQHRQQRSSAGPEQTPASAGQRSRTPQPLRAGTPSSRVRFERRASHARRRPWRLLAVLAGVVLLVAVAVWVVAFSALLATRTVSVTGLSDPGEQQSAREAAAIPLETPLARVDTAGAAERVGAIPTVATVTVSRSWPSTIVVSVQRKVPVAAVRNPQGQLQVVDHSGVAYETVPSLPDGIAEVNATSEAPDPEGVRAAIGVLELLPAQQRAEVSGLTVSSADLVTLQLGKVSVVWGGVADGPKKLAVLEALLPTNPGVIDVSAPDTPVTR